MIYPGMPDFYECKTKDHNYNMFWHDGEFYIHNRSWTKDNSIEFEYFDTVEEVMKKMLEIAPYKDWKVTDFE